MRKEIMSNATKPTATSNWNSMVSNHEKQGMTRQEAIKQVDKSHPGLRELMLEEANLQRR